MSTKNTNPKKASKSLSNLENQAVDTDQIKGGQGKHVPVSTKMPEPGCGIPQQPTSLQREANTLKH